MQGSQLQVRFEFDTVDQLFNGFRGWLIDDVVVQTTPGTFGTGDNPLFANYFYVDINSTTGLPAITPVSFNTTSGASIPLGAGSSQTFSATIFYSATVAGTIEFLLVDPATGTPSGAPFGSVAAINNPTEPTENSTVISGTTILPTAAGFVELWIQMIDSNNATVLAAYPVEYYVVQ